MRKILNIVSIGLFGLVFGLGVESQAAAKKIGIPLECSQGPSGQKEKVFVTIPPNAAQGSVYKVRIDGNNSGEISHVGLNYIFNMTYEWLVPKGTQFVSGSARIVPNTGTPNVRKGARVAHKNGVIQMVLPARVDDGSNYTPPSFEFELKVNAAPGTKIVQAYKGYRVTANALLVGDVDTTCSPVPKPYPVGTTTVDAAAAPAAPAPAK